jgi:hypothetical protein
VREGGRLGPSLFTLHFSLFTFHFSLFTLHSSLAARKGGGVTRHHHAVPYRSSGLPDLPPGCEFRWADSIAGEIAFMQAYEFGFDDLGETLAIAGVDLFF